MSNVRGSTRWLALCLWLSLAPACTHVATWQAHDAPWTDELVADAGDVRVERLDGREFLVDGAHIHTASGELRGRVAGGSSEFTISLEDITTLETRAAEPGGFFDGWLPGTLIGVTLVVVIVIAGILSIGGGFAGS